MSIIRRGEDAAHLAKILEARSQLGIGEDVRVEELTPVQHYELQMQDAHTRVMEAREALAKAQDLYDVALDDWETAWRKWEEAENGGSNAEENHP